MTTIWLLWQEDNTPWEYERDLLEIYSTKEIAQKHCDEKNKKQSEWVLNHWRETWNKRPDEFPDKDLENVIEYYIEDWDIKNI